MAKEPQKAHCNRCLRSTNHQIVFETFEKWEETDDGQWLLDGCDTYYILKCLGCDEFHYEHHHWFSGDADPDGDPVIHMDHYPPSLVRQKPIWRRGFIPFNWKLREFGGLIDEIYNAHAVGANRLAVMGIRALAERVMIDQVGDQGSFEKNISKFCGDGFVAKVQAPLFRETLIEAGHAAMHRNFEPTSENVSTLLDIIEGIINVIYYEPLKAKEVNKGIPSRYGHDEVP